MYSIYSLCVHVYMCTSECVQNVLFCIKVKMNTSEHAIYELDLLILNDLKGIHVCRFTSHTIVWLLERNLNIFTRKDAILSHFTSTTSNFLLWSSLSIYSLQTKTLLFIISLLKLLTWTCASFVWFFNLSINFFMPIAYQQKFNELFLCIRFYALW